MKGEKKLREVMEAKCIHESDRIELQDIIGRRSYDEIKEWYSSLETQQNRRMFLWIAFSVMGADSAMAIRFHPAGTVHLARVGGPSAGQARVEAEDVFGRHHADPDARVRDTIPGVPREVGGASP